MTPDLDIIIVSYNTRDDLVRCLDSLASRPPALLRTIFVVDNASTDGSPATVRDRWPHIRLITLDQNLGFAAANNRALAESRASAVLLLNSDTIVPAGAIDKLASRMDATGSVAAGPKLSDESGRPEISFGPMLSPWAEFAQRRRVRRAASDAPAAVEATQRLVARERHVDWISGACLLVRRDAAVDAGMLDERYFMYEEDVDFCAALRARGGRVLFTPEATVTHLRGRSIARAGSAAHAFYDRSHLAFYDKHLPRWAPLLRLWLRMRGRRIR